MTSRLRNVIKDCLTEVLLFEEIDPGAMEDFMSMSFDDFLAIDEEGEAGDESYEGGGEAINERRWLKLAGLLVD